MNLRSSSVRLRHAVSVSLVLVAAATAGCGWPGPPRGEPDVVGVIDSFEDDWLAAGQRRALVEERADDCPLSVSYDDGTRILRETPDGLVPIDWNDLRKGDRVRLWIDGGIAESCPGLALAEAIVVEARSR